MRAPERDAAVASVAEASPHVTLNHDVSGKTEAVAEDASRVTRGGVKYIAPAGWTLRESGALVVLTPPEGDSHVAIIETDAREPDAAVAAAWELYRKQPAPPLGLAVDVPGRGGWQQARSYQYELPPSAKRRLDVLARRAGQAWVVVIRDVGDSTVIRRAAQFTLLGQSLRPASHEPESFARKTAHALDAARLKKLDDFVELGRQKLDVPGVAVAIVQGGKVIHARGYGVRELGKSERVDANTRFGIGSMTKPLTTLLLAQLVDDGKLRWDEPVTEAYPAFELGDAATTAATRIEHLVCACTGLPRKDSESIFEYREATALTQFAALARLQPTTKFGEAFQYSNQMAAAAGFVAAHVAAPGQELGKGYDAAMQARIFAPLGMQRTTFDFARAMRANYASPHSLDIDAKPTEVSMDLNLAVVPQRPAGGAWSTANDMIQYVRLELARGVTPAGKRIVSEKNLLQRRERYARRGDSIHYGMGLFVDERSGVTRINHGGSMFGYTGQMQWLPEHGVGLVSLTNADTGGQLAGSLQRYLLELLFDAAPEAMEDLESSARTLRERLAKERLRLEVPPDSAALSALAARYEHPELGVIDVTASGADARFDVGEWSSAVASKKNDDGSVSFVMITPGVIPFNFVVGKAGEKRTLTMREAQHEYTFVEAD